MPEWGVGVPLHSRVGGGASGLTCLTRPNFGEAHASVRLRASMVPRPWGIQRSVMQSANYNCKASSSYQIGIAIPYFFFPIPAFWIDVSLDVVFPGSRRLLVCTLRICQQLGQSMP